MLADATTTATSKQLQQQAAELVVLVAVHSRKKEIQESMQKIQWHIAN